LVGRESGGRWCGPWPLRDRRSCTLCIQNAGNAPQIAGTWQNNRPIVLKDVPEQLAFLERDACGHSPSGSSWISPEAQECPRQSPMAPKACRRSVRRRCDGGQRGRAAMPYAARSPAARSNSLREHFSERKCCRALRQLGPAREVVLSKSCRNSERI